MPEKYKDSSLSPGERANNYRFSYDAMHYSDTKDGPLYPFGAGLGYKRPDYRGFEIKERRISIKGLENMPLHISFFMKNESSKELWGIPMVYISRKQGNVVPRIMELKAFEKRRLCAYEGCQIEIVLDKETFLFYDASMKAVVEPGEFTITIKDGTKLLWEEAITLSD